MVYFPASHAARHVMAQDDTVRAGPHPGGPCLDPECACCTAFARIYAAKLREAEASLGLSEKAAAEIGADAATVKELRTARSALRAEKEKFRMITGRSI